MERVASRAIIPSAQRMIELEGYIEDIAVSEGVPPAIVKGMAWQESKFDELSYRYNYNNPADRSYGIMHLTLPTANEVYSKAAGYSVTFTAQDLYEPILNIWLGARYLKTLYDKYANWNKAVAAYNAGSPRYTQAGMFLNQGYVNAVFKVANLLGSYVTSLAQKMLQ
jgi:soluble lytic murein transglycosylase-like protein